MEEFVLILALVVVIGVEAVARAVEQRAIQATRVATVAGTDHAIDKMGRYIRFGVLGAALVFVLFVYVTGASLALFLGPLAIFGIVRGALVQLEQSAAEASRFTRLRRALKDPNFADAPLALFFSAVDLQTPDHVKAWDAQIDRVELPWYVITTEAHHFASLAAEGGKHVLLLHTLGSDVFLLPAKLRVLLYANNAQKNRQVLKALPHIQHVQILHGDSDKPPSYSPLTKNFDHVFVAGQMAIDRYPRNGVHIPPERFHIVGRPQVAEITPARAKTADIERPVVVYMPTWRGFYEDTQFSSLDRADQIIQTALSLSRATDVIFKPHPLSYKDPDWETFDARIQAALGAKPSSGSRGQVSTPDLTPFDLYNRADVLVCDISSVMIDFLYSNKPFITVLPDGFTEEMRPNFPSLEAAYNVRADLRDLSAQLEDALGSDPLSEQRQKVRASAFGDLDRPPGAAFNDAVRSLVGPGWDDPKGSGIA